MIFSGISLTRPGLLQPSFYPLALPVLVLTFNLAFSGCKKPDVPEPHVEYPPSANFFVSPVSGDAPLPVRLTLTGVQKTNPLDLFVC
jgi:hypothetical protein